jgi:epoxyqueuosine reductase
MSVEGPEQNVEHVLRRCRELGFALAGVATLERSEWDDELLAWLAAGKHGSMEYLNRNVDLRLEPSRLLEGAVSCVMVADLYHTRGEETAKDEDGVPSGKIARYARGRDYHEEIKKRLHTLADELRAAHPGQECRAFVDTAPVLERELAQRAGLGWIGKHTLLIHPRVGSYMLLGGVMTTMKLRADDGARVMDHCGTCTRCIDACPTRAITERSVDATRCISYLTIERRGAIDAAMADKLSGWIYGCDICQEVCPHNSPRGEGAEVGERHGAYEPRREALPLLDVLGWTEEDRRREFQSSAMKRATLAMMKRNAILLAGDELAKREDAALRAAVERAALDESADAMVRDAARAVLSRGQ